MHLKTNTGRLRVVALFEGISLLVLLFITVPMKYVWGNPIGSEVIGPIHGILFILYVLLTFSVAGDHSWKFFKTTWLVLLASFIPFGTFYVDSKILKPIDKK
ncbi:MAG: DUF3817 domain-containing protein [Flavipsychrobacter sp.]